MKLLGGKMMQKPAGNIVYRKRYRHIGELTGESATREFTEVQIPIAWGYLAGKWYGPKDKQPILGLHGWQDNAGTYDLLVPLLPSDIAFLALDLPGHGLSTRLPDGIYYNSLDNLYVLLVIMEYYKWSKLYLIGHSLSATIGFTFAAVFPKKMGMLIGLDALKPHQPSSASSYIDILAKDFENFRLEDERNRRPNEPPSYPYEELIERMYIGTFESINRPLCKYMLARNIQPSAYHPSKYFFSRDRRVKFQSKMIVSQEVCLEMAKSMQCPYLFIKARDSHYFEDKIYYDQVFDVLKTKPLFKYFECDGTHHVHMNHPERIIEPIVDFIRSYGPASRHSNGIKEDKKMVDKFRSKL